MKKDLNKGLWDTSAAGHVDQGESYDTCAPRELREELNVTAPLTPLFKLSATPALGMEFIKVYHSQHNGPFEFATEEIDEIRWSSRDEIARRVTENDATLTETFKIIWRHYRNLRFLDGWANRPPEINSGFIRWSCADRPVLFSPDSASASRYHSEPAALLDIGRQLKAARYFAVVALTPQ